MTNDYFLHFTAKKNAIQAKDKIKPGNAASFRVSLIDILNVTLKQFEACDLPNVNRMEKPIAAGSKLILSIIFNSGFQSSERFNGRLANL